MIRIEQNPNAVNLPQIEGLRGLAVLLILYQSIILHRLPASFSNFDYGTAGGIIFFVLSGFLISRTLIYYKEKSDSRKVPISSYLIVFFRRRVLRIFPLYYFVVGLMCILPYFKPTYFWPYLTFTSNFLFFVNNSWVEPFGHTWSISVGMQICIVWPFLIFLVPKPKLEGAIWLFVASGVLFKVFAFAHIVPVHSIIGTLTPAAFPCFGLGAWLAYYRRYTNPQFAFADYTKWVVACCAFVAWYLNRNYQPASYGVLYELCIAVLALWLVAKTSLGFGGPVGAFFASPFLRFLGQISYGLYLWHVPCITFVRQLHLYWEAQGLSILGLGAKYNPDVISTAFALWELGLTLCLSIASYYALERPFLLLKDRRFGFVSAR